MEITPIIAIAKGVGRKDYSCGVELSTSPFVTPSQRQDRFGVSNSGNVATCPFPTVYVTRFSMPQEDGSWAWEASSIVVHIFDLSFSLKTNSLCVVGLLRYASLADYNAGIIAERFPQKFGYGTARVRYSRGIPTQKGSVYAILSGGWPDTLTYDFSEDLMGMVSELTPPWME